MNQTIKSLTGLRIYAALLVFVSHLSIFRYFLGLQPGKAPYVTLESLGALGVSTFFVLSGFILCLNYLTPERVLNVRQFLVARIARIYPIFVLATLFAVPLEILTRGHDGIWSKLAMSLGGVHCFWQTSCSAFTSAGWSISVEAFFYVAFPLLALLLSGQSKRKLLWFYSIYLTVIISIAMLIPDSFYARATFPVNRVGEFLAGMVGGMAYMKYQDHPRVQSFFSTISHTRIWIFLLVLGAILALQPVVIGKSGIRVLENVFFLYYTLPALAIILTLTMLENVKRPLKLLSHQWAVFGGEISYCFYLIHFPMLMYTLLLLKELGIDPENMRLSQGIPIATGVFVLCLALSWAGFKWIETPARRWITGLFRPGQTPVWRIEITAKSPDHALSGSAPSRTNP